MAKRNDMEQDGAGYDFYPDRRHLSEEFGTIWAAQAPHYPEILTDALREALYQTIFYQRPLKAPEVVAAFSLTNGVYQGAPIGRAQSPLRNRECFKNCRTWKGCAPLVQGAEGLDCLGS